MVTKGQLTPLRAANHWVRIFLQEVVCVCVYELHKKWIAGLCGGRSPTVGTMMAGGSAWGEGLQ